jgi:peptidyl-tRNA hydrolase
MVLDQRPE